MLKGIDWHIRARRRINNARFLEVLKIENLITLLNGRINYSLRLVKTIMFIFGKHFKLNFKLFCHGINFKIKTSILKLPIKLRRILNSKTRYASLKTNEKTKTARLNDTESDFECRRVTYLHSWVLHVCRSLR